MTTRYYCDWCGAETSGDNELDTATARTKDNSGYLYGRGPLIKVSVSVNKDAGGAKSHMCGQCLRNALRNLLCGERVERPDGEAV